MTIDALLGREVKEVWQNLELMVKRSMRRFFAANYTNNCHQSGDSSEQFFN